MKKEYLFAFFAIFAVSFASAIIVDADYITVFPGTENEISIQVDNNDDFDIEDTIFSLDLNNVPFTTVGSSSEDIGDIDEGDDETFTLTLRANADASPGDYSIPYNLRFRDVDSEELFTKNGTFGMRISAETDLDFVVETGESPIVGREGTLSLEIINSGLGEIRSLSVEIFPQGYELMSKEKVFVGSIDSDDTDIASFDVIYQSKAPVFRGKITYKNFDNEEQIQNINLPFRVYSEDEAKNLGLISQSNLGIYILLIIILVAGWIFWRRWRKNKRKNGLKK